MSSPPSSLMYQHLYLHRMLALPCDNPERVAALQHLASRGILTAFQHLNEEQREAGPAGFVWRAYCEAREVVDHGEASLQKFMREYRRFYRYQRSSDDRFEDQPAAASSVAKPVGAAAARLRAKLESKAPKNPPIDRECISCQLNIADNILEHEVYSRDQALLNRANGVYKAVIGDGNLAALAGLKRTIRLIKTEETQETIIFVALANKYVDSATPFEDMYKDLKSVEIPVQRDSLLRCGADYGDLGSIRRKIRALDSKFQDPRINFAVSYTYLSILANSGDLEAQSKLLSALDTRLQCSEIDPIHRRRYQTHYDYLLGLLEAEGATVEALETAYRHVSGKKDLLPHCVKLARRLSSLGSHSHLAWHLLTGVSVARDIPKAVILCRDSIARGARGEVFVASMSFFIPVLISSSFIANARVNGLVEREGEEFSLFCRQIEGFSTNDSELLVLLELAIELRLEKSIKLFCSKQELFQDPTYCERALVQFRRALEIFPKLKAKITETIAYKYLKGFVPGVSEVEADCMAYDMLREVDESRWYDHVLDSNPLILATLYVDDVPGREMKVDRGGNC